MTPREIRPKQFRALLLLLVLVPLIPAAMMIRFMLDTLRVERLAAFDRLQQLHGETLAAAIRAPLPAAAQDDRTKAAALLGEVRKLGAEGITARVVDGAGHLLAGEADPWGQPLAQSNTPQIPGATVQLFMAGPEVLDATIADQRWILTGTAVATIFGVVLIAGLTALALNHQLALRELKNTSVATVAHELRTPLASMRMLVDTLREGRYRGEEKLREYLDLIAAENERLSRLAESFLTFSRRDRNAPVLETRAVAVDTVVERAITPLKPRFDVPGCAFSCHIEAPLPPVQADADALSQVLTNLLDNALKYSEPPQRVGLRAYRDGNAVAFAVSDNGIGIPEEERRSIFEPFYQVDRKLSRRREGCGLGLAIVRDIVEAHRGTIDVASQPGKGSVFTVKIPSA